MVTTTTAIDALTAALALARAEGRTVRGMKDLLCDACGEGVALRAGGYCHACADSLNEHFDARAAEHLPGIMEEQGDNDLARWCVGDDEGEALARGIRC